MLDPDNYGGAAPEGTAPTVATRPAKALTAASMFPDGSELCRALVPVAARAARGGVVGMTRMPVFLADPMRELQDAIDAGKVRRCRHGGQAWHLAWEPRRLRCTACASEAMARLSGTVEDQICDACRCIAGTLRTSTLIVGDLVVIFGTCTPCLLSGQVIRP